MKRILALSILLGLAAGQMPMHAESKLLVWAKDSFTQETVKKGLSSLKADAKALGTASVNILKKGFPSLNAQTLLNAIKDPKVRISMAMGTALVAPFIAGFRAYRYEEGLTTAQEKELKEQLCQELEVALGMVNAVNDYCYKYTTGSVFISSNTDMAYIDAEIKVRAFYNSLKVASENLATAQQSGENNNLKHRIDALISLINEDLSQINPDNKAFEDAFLNLKAVMQVVDDIVSNGHLVYCDWYPAFKMHVSHVDSYLNNVRAKKIAVIDQETRRKKALEKLKVRVSNTSPFVMINNQLRESLNRLKDSVIVGDVHPSDLNQTIKNQLMKFDSSIVPPIMLLTFAGISAPLMAYASYVADNSAGIKF